MTEEPRLDEAVQKLMALLDTEVPRSLIRFKNLDASVVADAEDYLYSRPSPATLERTANQAREKVRLALYKWLEATGDRLHFN